MRSLGGRPIHAAPSPASCASGYPTPPQVRWPQNRYSSLTGGLKKKRIPKSTFYSLPSTVYLLIVLAKIGDLPGIRLLPSRDHPIPLEATAVGDIDGGTEDVFNMVRALPLRGELVVHDRFAGSVIDRLSGREL